MGKMKEKKSENNKNAISSERRVQKRNGSFKNKEKVLVVSSRGITFRCVYASFWRVLLIMAY